MSEATTVKRNVAKVREFIDGWGAVDVEGVMSCLSKDIIYVNQPIEPVVGHENVRKIVGGIMELSSAVNWELRNCFGYGSVVVTERLDCWGFDGNGWGLKLPCIGMFDVNDDGLINGWRDYFDNQMWFENGGPTLHLD